ncbi:MAG: HNH endonuclease [Ignavibacteriales bacterium]|nr:HNH endonuclease [Ignavibacteriales bacterium]
MFKCILCCKDFDNSKKTEEHIFPESIGGNICLWEMCKNCNSHLGKNVDAPMINNFQIEAKRQLLKLSGKKGHIPNPLEDGVLSSDPSQKVKYKFKNGLPDSLYIVPNFKYRQDENGNNTIQIILDKKDEHKLPEILEKIKKRTSKNGKPVEFSNIKKFEGRDENPWMKMTKIFNLYDWQRCVIKIAYEMTYRKLGVNYLYNPIAIRIRELLKKEKIDKTDLEDAKLKGNINLANASFNISFVDDPNCLYVVFLPIDGKLICLVRIFDVFEGFIITDDTCNESFPVDGEIIKIDVINKSKEELKFIDFITQQIKLNEQESI